jgi:hypothetical protein
MTTRKTGVDYDPTVIRVEILDDTGANIGTYFEPREQAPEAGTGPGNCAGPNDHVLTMAKAQSSDGGRIAVLALILAILALFIVAMAGCSSKRDTTVAVVTAAVPTAEPKTARLSFVEPAPASSPSESNDLSAPVHETAQRKPPNSVRELGASIEKLDAKFSSSPRILSVLLQNFRSPLFSRWPLCTRPGRSC